jgi:hypothetical protein
MSGMTAVVNEKITSLYDFSRFNKIVDVGWRPWRPDYCDSQGQPAGFWRPV